MFFSLRILLLYMYFKVIIRDMKIEDNYKIGWELLK